MQVTLVPLHLDVPIEMLCDRLHITLHTLDTTKQCVRQQLAISSSNASTKLKNRQQIHIKDDIWLQQKSLIPHMWVRDYRHTRWQSQEVIQWTTKWYRDWFICLTISEANTLNYKMQCMSHRADVSWCSLLSHKCTDTTFLKFACKCIVNLQKERRVTER